MRAVRDSVPREVPEARAHCLASALIARRCSVTEARLAGFAKEFRDVFTRGDASWSDWQADRAGLRCAKWGADVDALSTCCATEGY